MKEFLELIGMILIYGIAILALVGIPVLTVKFVDWICGDKKNTTPPEEKEIDIENGEAETNDEYPYIKPYLLTKKEWAFYKALKPITDKYHLHILAKVRLADLVEVKKGLSSSQYFKAFAKIKAKHVDFVLARPANLAVLCAIEVDDGSHDDIERQKRDFFLDKVCETVKLPLIRYTDINGVEDQICEKLKIHKK